MSRRKCVVLELLLVLVSHPFTLALNTNNDGAVGLAASEEQQQQKDSSSSQQENEEDLYYWDPADDVYWDELPAHRRAYYIQVGWTKRMWDSGEDAYFQFSWEEQSLEVQRALTTLGWTQDMWDEDDVLFMERWNGERDVRRDRSTQIETKLWIKLTEQEQEAATLLGYDCDTWPAGCGRNHVWSNTANDDGTDLHAKFDPTLGLLRNLSLAPLDRLDLVYFASLAGTDGDVEVELTDGTTVGDDEYCERKRGYTLSRYAHDLLTHGYSTGGAEPQEQENDSNEEKPKNFYLKYEDYDPFKIALMRTVGTTVIQTLSTTLSSNAQLRSHHLWIPSYDRVRQFDNSNWVVWVGGEGTSTSMHYDDDEFNFIYVAQGKKKVVVLPNNEQTNHDGRYACLTEVDGHSCWTGVDLLNISSSSSSTSTMKEEEEWVLPEHATEIILEAGDGIVIPYMSWHAVLNLEPTVAYGFRINAFQYEDDNVNQSSSGGGGASSSSSSHEETKASRTMEMGVGASFASNPSTSTSILPLSHSMSNHGNANKDSVAQIAAQKEQHMVVENVVVMEEGSWDRVTTAVRDAAKYLGYDESSDWSSLHKIQL